MPISNADMPAMPMVIEKDEYVWCEGLTKREQFAMAAMQGLCARSDYYHTPQDLVSDAVKCADALLAELDKAGGE